MATRFKTGSRQNFGQKPLPTGYENSSGTPDIVIPSCGIEDVDVAMFNLFEKEIAPECGGIGSMPVSKVPVIFAAGEKWALLKRGRPIRDRNNTLLLPLITIMRTDFNQTAAEDITGRGINQQVGEIVIRRRLDKSDRDYQNLINKFLLPNQENLAVNQNSDKVSGQVSTGKKTGSLAFSKARRDGAYLSPHRVNNVYETIVVPTPQFYTIKYQVTVWTQYTQHSNQILEKIISSFLPQGMSWKLDTPKGYWFVAKVDDGSYAVETNFEDMSQQERFIKNTFTVTVPAYFFVSAAPGMPVPVKRYVSSPIVSFESLNEFDDVLEIGETKIDSSYVLGSDDPTLPLDTQHNNRKDQRNIGWRLQKVYPILPEMKSGVAEDIDYSKRSDDPAVSALPRGYSIKVINKNSKGEVSYSGASLENLEILVVGSDEK